MVCAELFFQRTTSYLDGTGTVALNWMLFAPRDIWQYLVIFGVVETLRKGAMSMYLAEALTIAKHLTIYRTVSHTKIIISPKMSVSRGG